MAKKFSLTLPLMMLVSACGSHNSQPDSAASSSDAVTAVSSEAAVTTVPEVNTSVASDDGADRFSCAYGGNKADEYEVVMTNFVPSSDHMGPIGDYKVTGGGPYSGSTGAVRISDETYEFLDGPLGKVKATIVPASQGFYALLVGKEGVQCDKQGANPDQ